MSHPLNQHSNDLRAVRALMWAGAVGGLAVFLYALLRLPVNQLDGRFALVCLLTVGLGSRIVVDIQLLKSNISVSDIFIILTILLFGNEAGVVLAAVEAYCTSFRFTKQARIRFFNAGVMALSFWLATTAVAYWFGPLTRLVQEKLSARFLAALATLVLIHYFVNTGLMGLANALRTGRAGRSWWLVWREYYAWMFVTYLASGSVALLTANAINRWSFNAFLVGLPVVGVIYFSYRSYHRQLEITQQQVGQARQHLREMEESEERFRGAFGEAPIGMALSAHDGRWLQVNRALCELLGYTEEEFLAAGYDALVHPLDVGNWLTLMGRVLQGREKTQQAEIRLFHQDGHEIWTATSLSVINLEEGQPQRFIFQIQDITARRQAEEQLRHAAFYDALTGLPNRRYFTDRVQEALTQAQSDSSYRFAVALIDLRRFRLIKESIGPAAGDHLLTQFARRLQHLLPQNHTVARLSGDEFTILLHGVRCEDDALEVVARLQTQLAAPFKLPGHEIFVNANMGLALYDASYATPEELLRDAGAALQQVKLQGKTNYAVFDQAMNDRARERLQLETDLRYAVKRQEFFPVYQPIICLHTQRLVGFECLVRWQHPQRGLVSPLEFISLAEETGHIVAIGKFVLLEACRQLRRWQEQFASELPLTMSVNVSAKQIIQGHIIEQVMEALSETGIAPQHLKLELTESVVMDNIEEATSALRQLRAMGVQLSMDDFGTGYSSLSYLHRLPITTLKIDRSFVTPLAEKPESAAIVNTIILLANNLGLEVIAEGIETRAQWDKLREAGCGYGQGFLFSKPLKVDEAGSLLRDTFNTVPRVTHFLRPNVPQDAPAKGSSTITHTEVLELKAPRQVS